MSEEKPTNHITNQMQQDVTEYWEQYKKEYNISDNIILILLNGNLSLKRLVDALINTS